MDGSGELTYVAAGEDDDGPGWSVLELPARETVGFAPSLRCFPRTWDEEPPAWSVKSELESVRVESLTFTQRFDARAHGTQEQNWLLQLLSPDFIAWLSDEPQAAFGFELHEGTLRCFTPGRVEGAEADRFRREAEAVAERARSEAVESEGLGVRELGSGISERIERTVAKVRFDQPPPDARVASQPFKRYAAREPGPYVAALAGVVAIYTLIFGATLEVGLDVIGVVIDVFTWIGPQGTGMTLAIITVLGWAAALPEAIAIAARRYGRVAFAREYAKAHGLRLESPQSFHRRLMRIDLPAPAQFVMHGMLPGGREGRLVLCRSTRAILSDHYDAVIFEAPGLEGKGVRAGRDYATRQGHLVVTRKGSADRSAEGLDAFCVSAAKILEDLRSGRLAGQPPAPEPAAQGATSSTSPSGS